MYNNIVCLYIYARVNATGLEKTSFYTHYKYLDTTNLIIGSSASQEGKQMLACIMPQFYSYS